MLVLTRKVGESIIIDKNIKITAMNSACSNQIRIGIEAPEGVKILREELLQRDMSLRAKDNKK